MVKMTAQQVQDINDALLSIVVHTMRMKMLAEIEFERFGRDGWVDVGLLLDRYEFLSENISKLNSHMKMKRKDKIFNK